MLFFFLLLHFQAWLSCCIFFSNHSSECALSVAVRCTRKYATIFRGCFIYCHAPASGLLTLFLASLVLLLSFICETCAIFVNCRQGMEAKYAARDVLKNEQVKPPPLSSLFLSHSLCAPDYLYGVQENV